MVRFLTMRLLAGLIAAQVLGSAAVATAGDRTADEARPRVEHHLLEAEQIVRHFESVIAEACPRSTRLPSDGPTSTARSTAWCSWSRISKRPGRKPSGHPTRTSDAPRRRPGLKSAKLRAWSRSSSPA